MRMPSKKAQPAKTSRAVSGTKAATVMESRAFIGTSGWAYTSWKPGFYPQAVPSKKFLDYYTTQLNSVEVNYTFRQLPNEAMIDSWLKASNDSFRFSFKAPQRITHFLRLKNCSEAVAALSLALAPVKAAGRMGVVLIQLPPNFKADMSRLESFLADTAGCALRMAFEFRHSSWLSEETYDVLRRHNVALCIAESETLTTPDLVTASFAYYRFRRDGYSRAKLAAIAETVRRRSAAGEVFAYFKHQQDPDGPIRAVATRRTLCKITIAMQGHSPEQSNPLP